ncbi:8652_t:CDS:2 [Paraglomus occultum]|uniref:8652_t:CDS:1 n=1 Tax=Paraglomus occultum TaxID=144539 RepID=A0A9N8W7E6_9GLOM|nr:8652_t:CDS:2 [Paraglomus occultum]
MPSDAYTSFAPTTERAVGRRGRVGFPADYPLAFQDAGEYPHSNLKFDAKRGVFIETDQDLLNAHLESVSQYERSPLTTRDRSILAQTTPRRTSTTALSYRSSRRLPTYTSTPSHRVPVTPPISATRSNIFSAAPPSAFTEAGRIFVPLVEGVTLRKCSEVCISEFDREEKLKPNTSIITTFDPEKDKELYEKAIDVYKNFRDVDANHRISKMIIKYTRSLEYNDMYAK